MIRRPSIAMLVCCGLWTMAWCSGAAWGQEIPPQDRPLGETRRQETRWPPRAIDAINVNPAPESDKIPPDSANELTDAASAENWHNAAYAAQTKLWYPPSLLYNPLYFEDPFLERNGDTTFRHPLFETTRGAARFGTQLFVLPYNAVAAPPLSGQAPPAVDSRGRALVTRPALIYGRRR